MINEIVIYTNIYNGYKSLIINSQAAQFVLYSY